jgi:hypothetical protein
MELHLLKFISIIFWGVVFLIGDEKFIENLNHNPE